MSNIHLITVRIEKGATANDTIDVPSPGVPCSLSSVRFSDVDGIASHAGNYSTILLKDATGSDTLATIGGASTAYTAGSGYAATMTNLNSAVFVAGDVCRITKTHNSSGAAVNMLLLLEFTEIRATE